jgi:hypothetical protein
MSLNILVVILTFLIFIFACPKMNEKRRSDQCKGLSLSVFFHTVVAELRHKHLCLQTGSQQNKVFKNTLSDALIRRLRKKGEKKNRGLKNPSEEGFLMFVKMNLRLESGKIQSHKIDAEELVDQNDDGPSNEDDN